MIAAPLPRLYVICDADCCVAHGWTLPDFAAACMDGGATLLQIRAKHLSSRALLDAVGQASARARQFAARIIVNDRADIAKMAGAAGVHVGQDDLQPADVRMVVGSDAIVGLSTHTDAQIEAAATEPVNYVAIGPVFGTSTKATGYEARGLDMVRRVSQHVAAAGLPLVAIGGITLDRSADVIRSGATSVAVISDVLVGGDPAARVRAFLERLARV